ncbi:MAG TPA: OmpH family outer membrane protein [Methylomirabilota bacterium]|jgi:outer membrane protein
MRRELLATVIVAGAWLLGGTALAQTPATPPPTSPSTASSARIGYVDIRRVFVRSQAGVAAREALERERAQMQREMDTRRQEIDKLREELDKKGTLLTPDVRREKEDTLERKRRDATRMADDFQRDLVRKEQQLLARVQQEVSGVIERLGKQRGYYMILEMRNAGVLYSASEADVTDEVIRAYDQESAKGKK